MPDSSSSKAKPPAGFQSALRGWSGGGQQPSFSSLLEPVQEPWHHIPYVSKTEIGSLLKPLTFHAEPLTPLRQRDEHALEDIFGDIHIEEIFSDVFVRLKQLYPEPCWEDEPFDFLKSYL